MIAELKEEVRRRALANRALLKQSVPELSHRMAEIFVSRIPLPPASVVSAYVAIGEEADPAPLLESLRARGHTVVLPRVVGRGKPLEFHRYEAGAPLVPGGFGLLQPARDWPIIDPDILAVPLLAFDGEGYRVGYGAGFYDRTLARLRAARDVVAVGFAFAAQEFPEVPHDENDQRLDWIVTENGARRFSGRV
jgi:5-formyltetrahydrofolate cyclo-ligase